MNKKKINKKNVNGDFFVKVDLHVHTPASVCYKGNKDDDEYLRILKSAAKKDIKILAITDHNSIRGYKKIIEIKSKLVEDRAMLSAITDSVEAKSKLLDINTKLSLFEDLLILPGVEFEVSNGIHLLIVFNESTEIDRIEKFLLDGGYDDSAFGREEPTIRSKWDIFDLYEQSKKYDCIVIDAHTDAAKGIWKTIPRGRVRADCFRDTQLCAVGYKSEKQKENIIRLLTSSKEYNRVNPLAFVRFSDAHHHKDVGSLITWVKIEKNAFASLRNAFANPTELVSTELPELDKILNTLIKEETAFGISDLNSQEKITSCKKLFCALNNSTGGYLLFGVTPEMTKVGLPTSEKNERGIPKVVTKIKDCFQDIDGDLLPPIFRIYPLQNDREVVSVHVPLGDHLATIKGDGCIYTIIKREIGTLKGTEIQSLIEERIYRNVEARINKRMSEIEKNCLLTKNLFLSIPIIRKFENTSIRMPFRPDIIESIKLSGQRIEKLKENDCNGKSKGNIFFLKEDVSPRLKYAYLRYSVPLFNIRGIDNKPEDRETIYIVPGGGVFYSKRNYPFFGEVKKPILKLYNMKRFLISMKFMVAYLKSSFLLWYLLSKLDEKNLYLPNVYKSIRIPILDNAVSEDRIRKIEQRVDDIMKLEREYLVACQSIKGKKLLEITNKHNCRIDTLACSIDLAIYKIIGLSEPEIKTIENHLKLNDIYLSKEASTLSLGS